MGQYAVIVENDESEWGDITGQVYHFPHKYLSILQPGCKVIYYKGKLKKQRYSQQRLSDAPHYFGLAEMGPIVRDNSSTRKAYFGTINACRFFESAVLAKINEDEYLEPIPKSKKSNYWRDGVREITKDTFERITGCAKVQKPPSLFVSEILGEYESYSAVEGEQKKRYTTYYERSPINRQLAIEIHGYDCMVCGFNFELAYGELGTGFIHVHHNKPISESGPMTVDPKRDLSVLCPNCHAMIHRDKNITLSVDELRYQYENHNK